jgi:hypothetical protein
VNFVKRLFGFPELRDWLLAAGFAAVTGHGEDGQPLTADHKRMVIVAALFQHRSLQRSTACRADRFGRYPQESSWNTGSARSPCRKASQTSHFEMSDDLPCDFSLSTQLLPEISG